jgi:hypothetical protein
VPFPVPSFLPLSFWLSSSKRICFCFAFALVVVYSLLLPAQKTVISTEAAHCFIVSSAAEKSASLPHHLSANTAHLLLPFCCCSSVFTVVFVVALLFVIPEGDLLLPSYFACRTAHPARSIAAANPS